MSLYAEYIAEREDLRIFEDEDGFATYKILGPGGGCYIIDIYVRPSKRQRRKASHYANEIASFAKAQGCSHLIGSVDPSCKGGTKSLKVLLGYGFELTGIENNMIWFRKDL
jgi:ribosomal protein S18 acetylase RimI-like enzyme